MKYRFKILLIVFLVSLSSIGFAITVTTDSDEIVFEDVLAGGYAEETVEIRSDTAEPTEIVISAPEFIKDWFSFEPNTMPVSLGVPAKFKIMLHPPSNITKGNYESYLVINTISKGNEVTTSMATAMDIKTKIEITDKEIMQAVIDDFSIEKVKIGDPIEALITIENKGNIELPLSIHIDILDNDNIINPTNINSKLLPSAIEIIKASIPNDLSIGEYTAQIQVFSENMLIGKQILYFNVVEKVIEEPKETIVIKQDELAIPLSTNVFIFLLWLVILIFVFVKVKNIKKKGKK